MKRDAVGRVSYTEQQREALLEEFERSGLKGTQFALAAGVKYQTLAHWLQQRRHARGVYAGQGSAQGGTAPLRLVEAVVAGVGTGPGDSGAAVAQPLELHLPGGARMLVATAHQADLAARLLQTLARSC